jgi:hypothetical protein
VSRDAGVGSAPITITRERFKSYTQYRMECPCGWSKTERNGHLGSLELLLSTHWHRCSIRTHIPPVNNPYELRRSR